jgi:hypothetical protein
MNTEDMLRDDCERDAEDERAEARFVSCPYCGGRGTQEWFANHDHGPSPFEDDEPTDAQLTYWGSRSELFAPPRSEYHGD